MLLALEDIQARMDKKVDAMELELSRLRLMSGGLADHEISALEKQAGHRLPVDFEALIRRYDFTDLSIGPVDFSFTRVLPYEISGFTIDPQLPEGMLLIAGSDPHDFAIDATTGEIRLLDSELREIRYVVARSFELFVRGVATVMLMRQDTERPALAASVAFAVGAQSVEFWEWLAG